MLRLTFLASTLLLASCGPFVMPMFHRLDDEQQAAADQIWHNMLTPANRLERQTLLDTVCVNYLYGMGVDRASYHAEKRVDHQLVTLDITFDRERPLRDEFSLAVIGGDGRVLRRETWSRAEVEAALGPGRFTFQQTSPPSTQPDPQEVQREKDLAVRVAKMEAATQPDTPQLRQSLADRIKEIKSTPQP